MKLKILLFIILCNVVVANSSSGNIESETKKLATEMLDGKNLVVRVYNTSENTSSEYEKVRVRLSGLSFSHKDIKQSMPYIDGSYLVIVTAVDQADSSIAAVLDRYVPSSNFNEQRVQNIWPDMNQADKNTNLVFCDALGNPIPNAMIEVAIDLTITRGRGIDNLTKEPITYDVLDSQGVYKSPVWAGSHGCLAYIVSHPNYGRVLVPAVRGYERSKVFILPIVPLDSEYASRSFQGRIVDENDVPVTSMPVSIGVVGSEANMNQYSKTSGMVITDANGCFNYYPPLELNGKLYTELAPDTIRCNLWISPSKSLNMISYENVFYQREFQIGNERRKIILASMNPDQYFHTFTFIDEQEEIINSKKLETITLTVSRDNRTWQTLTYDDFKNGCYLNLGELRASMMRGNRLSTFSVISLTEDTPEEIVLTTGQEKIYSGIVIDALTGQPVPNVLVLAESGPRRNEDYARIEEQVEELRLRAASELMRGLTKEQLYETDMRLALTDQYGVYKFVFRRGIRENLEYFNVIDKNYHSRRVHLYEQGYSEEENMFYVKTIELLPPPKIKNPPVFVFEDEFGNVISDENILKKINISVELGDGGGITGNYESEVPKSMYWNYGTYNATLKYGDYDYIYEPVVINQDSPEVIVFKIKEEKFQKALVLGSVVNGITDEPMSGVIVYANEKWTSMDMSKNPYENMNLLNSLEGDYDIESSVFQELINDLGATTLSITNAEGRFELPVDLQAVSRSPLAHITAVTKDYLGARQSLDYMLPVDMNSSETVRTVPYEPDEDGTITFPPMRLFPSGQIKLELNLPETSSDGRNRMRVVFQFRTSPRDTTPWIKKFWETPRERGGARVLRTTELRPNGKQTIPLPAGVELTLIMYTLHNRTGGITLPGIKLEQGQTLDLGLIEFPDVFEVNVKVTDSLGKPVSNVPVRSLDEFNLYRGQQVETNSDGIASLSVTPNSRGRFVVPCKNEETQEVISETIFFEVKGNEDAGKEFLLELSDELLINLLK